MTEIIPSSNLETDDIDNEGVDVDAQRDTEEREPFLRKIRGMLGRSAVHLVTTGRAKIEDIQRARSDRSEQKTIWRENAEFDHEYQDITRDTEQLVTDDVEILGNSQHFGTEFRAKERDAKHNIDSKITEFRKENPLSTMREAWLTLRRDHYQGKVDRLKGRIDTSPDTFWNRRRKDRLDMLKNRVSWRNTLLNKRAGKKNKIQAKYEKRDEKRDENFKKRVDYYIHKKIDAMRKKEQRKLMKQEGIKPFSPGERAKFLASLSTEQRKQLTRSAILEVRKENIRKGKLDLTYSVDNSPDTRKVGDYERTDTK